MLIIIIFFYVTKPLFTGRNGRPAAGAHLPQFNRRLLEHHPKSGGRRHKVNHRQTRIVQDGHVGRRVPSVRAEHLRRHTVHPVVVGGRHGRRHLWVRNRVYLLLCGKHMQYNNTVYSDYNAR